MKNGLTALEIAKVEAQRSEAQRSLMLGVDYVTVIHLLRNHMEEETSTSHHVSFIW